MANFAYLIGSRETRECLLVDPAWSVDALLDRAARWASAGAERFDRDGARSDRIEVAQGRLVGVARSTIRRLHDPRPPAGHDREATLCQLTSHLIRHGIVWVRCRKTGGAKDGDTWTHKMKCTKARKKFAHNAAEHAQFPAALLRAFKKPTLVRRGRRAGRGGSGRG